VSSALIRCAFEAFYIAHFEAVAIPWALRIFVELLPKDSHVVWAVDNQNVYYGFKNGFARMPYIFAEIDDFMSIILKHNVWVEFVWVPSAINLEADIFSRSYDPMHELELHDVHWSKFLLECKSHNFPIPSLDAFASAQNAKCAKYFAKVKDGAAIGNFWFTPLTQHEIYYIFSPFGKSLSGVLSRIQSHKALAWVVLPRWTARLWWHITSKASFHFPLIPVNGTSPFLTRSYEGVSKPFNFQFPVDIWFFDFRPHIVERDSAILCA